MAVGEKTLGAGFLLFGLINQILARFGQRAKMRAIEAKIKNYAGSVTMPKSKKLVRGERFE